MGISPTKKKRVNSVSKEIDKLLQQPLSKKLFPHDGNFGREHIYKVFGEATIGKSDAFVDKLVAKVSLNLIIVFVNENVY